MALLLVRSPLGPIEEQLPTSPSTRPSRAPFVIELGGLGWTVGLVTWIAGFVFSSRVGLRDALRLTGFNKGKLCSFIDSDSGPEGLRLRGKFDLIEWSEDVSWEILRFMQLLFLNRCAGYRHM